MGGGPDEGKEIMVSKEKPVPVAENALARKALEAIAQIDAEAQKKKEAQLDELRQAKEAIRERMEELARQEGQIDAAIGHVTGKHARVAGPKRNLSEIRDRVVRWLSAHAGTPYTGEKMVQEFPEMKGTAVSIILKPAIDGGQIVVDASRGRRQQTYTAK